MDSRDRRPVRADTSGAEPPARRRDYWEKYGWETTLSLSVGIGAFGSLQFLVGLSLVPIHPVVNVLGQLAVFLFGPLLALAGIAAFSMPVYSAARYWWWD